jgi:O-succinylhomoserine sulfhydrylase
MADDGKKTETGKSTPVWRPRTQAVRGGVRRTSFQETAEPIFLTSGFVYGSAEEAETAFLPGGGANRFIYSRYGNPTTAMFEERLRMMEGAEACRATASGMAAVFCALASQLKSGDRIVSSRALFGSCHYIVNDILPRWGVQSVLVDGSDLEQWRKALDRPTTMVFLESPSNPMLEVIDLRAVSDMAHAVGAKVVVDNVFATPLLQKPLDFGADIICYSATKHIDGQGRTLGGAILSTKKFIEEDMTQFYRHTGPSLSPFNAWVLLKGLETMALRLDAQCKSALSLAHFLEGHSKTSRVLYPHLDSHPQAALSKKQMSAGGSVITVEVKGGKEGAFRFMNALTLVDISNNLGDSKSLATHPATTTHQRIGPVERAKLGISDGVVRLSVGLEDEADLRTDLENALAKV